MRALLVVAMSVLLAGCGAAKSNDYEKTAPATIDQDMRDALAGLTSVTVQTKSTASGTPFSMTASIDSTGRCDATLTEGDQTLRLIATDARHVYAKATSAFWASEVGVTKKLADELAQHWVTSLPEGIYSGVCSLTEVIKPFTSNTVAQDKPKVVGTTSIAGAEVVNLQAMLQGTTATISVASTSPHYPLKVTTADDKRTETLSGFNKPVTVSAPTQALDLKRLSGSK